MGVVIDPLTGKPRSGATTAGDVAKAGGALQDILAAVDAPFYAALRAKKPATLPVITETQPSIIVSTRYYIDPISGNDSNNGTDPATPWASLNKVVWINPAGTHFLLANDAVFDYEQDWASYKASPLFNNNNLARMVGTAASPVVVKPYSARQAPTGSKPIVRWCARMQAADWTLEAGYGGKVWSATWASRGTYAWRTNGVLFGPNRTVGVAPGHDTNGPAVLANDGEYAVDTGKIYVYTATGANPTTYYGEIRIIGGNKLFSNYGTDLGAPGSLGAARYIKFSGIRFEGIYAFDFIDYSTATNDPVNVEISECEFDRCLRALQGGSHCTLTVAKENTFVFRNNVITNPFGPTVVFTSSNNTYNSVSWDVNRNIVRSGNLSQSYGGALVYTQAKGGTKHHAWANYGYDIRNGTGGCEIDGSFLYADLNSLNSVFFSNIVERSGIAIQANRTANFVCIANLAIDCGCLVQSTQALPETADTNLSSVIAHNTWLWTGRVSFSQINAGVNIGGTGQASWAKHPVYVLNNQQQATGGAKLAYASIVNNLAVNASGTQMTEKPFAEICPNRVATNMLSVSGNASAGLSSTLLVYDRDNAGDKWATKGYMALVGTSADGRNWLPNYALGVARPGVGSPLIGAGSRTSVQYNDIAGAAFLAYPTIGCFEAGA